MSIAQLFYNEKNLLGEIEFDVTISESATAVNTATKNPVEDGPDVTDHVRTEPMTFSVSGIVSNTPVRILGGTRSGNLSGDPASQKAWDKLLELHAKREPFTLVQGMKSYKNIVMVQLSKTTDASNSNALAFTAQMQELILVGVRRIDEFNFDDPAVSAGMQPTQDYGIKDA